MSSERKGNAGQATENRKSRPKSDQKIFKVTRKIINFHTRTHRRKTKRKTQQRASRTGSHKWNSRRATAERKPPVKSFFHCIRRAGHLPKEVGLTIAILSLPED